MGNCAITFTANGKVYSVKALNGKISKLYEDSKSYVKKISKKFPRIQSYVEDEDHDTIVERDALRLWAIPRLEEFKKWAGDWTKVKVPIKLDKNGEPNLKDVLRFLDQHNIAELTPLQIRDFLNLVRGLGFDNFKDFQTEFNKTFYPNGYFEISKSAINRSKLLSKKEKNRLLSDHNVHKKTKEFSNSVKQSMSDKFVSKYENKLRKSDYYDWANGIKDASKIFGFGKSKYLNPYEVEQNMGRILAGIKTKSAFDNAIKSIPYTPIIEKYHKDSRYAQRLFERFSKMPRVNIYKDVNGKFTQPKMSNTQIKLTETLKAEVEVEGLRADKHTLNLLDEDILNSNPNEVDKFLKTIENKAKRINLDIEGFAEIAKIKPLSSVKKLGIGTINLMTKAKDNTLTPKDIEVYSQELDDYFGNDQSPMVSVNDLTNLKEKVKNLSDRTLIYYVGTKSEIQLFKDAGLIHIGDNIYQKINKIPQKYIYEALYEALLNDISILPKNALNSVYSNGKFNINKLLDPNNKAEIIKDLKTYINKLKGEYNENVDESMSDVFEQMLIHKIIFELPINGIDTQITKESEIDKYVKFNGDAKYLTDEFIADFQSFILKNRGTEIYEELLQHLDISDNGIILKSNDPITIEELSFAVEEFMQDKKYKKILNNLFQHSLISKNNDLYKIFEHTLLENNPNIGINDLNFLRMFYHNNHKLAPQLKSDYSYDAKNDVLYISGLGENFIRAENRLFEKVLERNGITYYKSIPINNNVHYNNYSDNLDISHNINFSEYEKLVSLTDINSIEKENIFSSGEISEINDLVDECAG